MDIFDVLTLIGGLCLFLFGMNVMGQALERRAGNSLHNLLGKLTTNKAAGLFTGLGVTAVIQSSSATTVMVVGFVNSGLMTLKQAINVIMGANIGTTVTAWILSLGGIEGDALFLQLLKPMSFTPILALIGIILYMFCKSDKKKDTGTILLGFAVLMFGMDIMTGSVSGLADVPEFQQLFIMFKNPILGVLAGAILTAIIQSSSASVGILQALSLTGAIPVSTAIPIILGQNIGTTITPILSSINGNTDSKRVALACLYIKMLGVIIVGVVFYAICAFVKLPFMGINASPFNIAVIHTLFNIISTIILMPFCSFIEKLTILSVKEKNKSKAGKKTTFRTLDERFLAAPSFAVETCRQVVSEMAAISKKTMLDSMSLIDAYDENLASDIIANETEVDEYEDATSSYLLQISEQDLSQKDSREVSQLLHVVGDVERIADHAVNIMGAAKEIHNKNISFSEEAQREISIMANAVREILSLAVEALINEDLNVAKKVEPLEQIIDKLNHKIKKNHIERLRTGNCTIELGFVLSDILTNFERVSDHCSNIAVCLLEIENNSLQTHEYLSNVKETGANEFFEFYDMYKKRYSL